MEGRCFAHPGAGTRPRLTRCKAIGYTGGRNGSCRIAVVVGYSHSHSLAHVGARLAALGLGRIDERTCATAHEWHLLFGWPDRSDSSRHLCPVALVRKHPKPRTARAAAAGGPRTVRANTPKARRSAGSVPRPVLDGAAGCIPGGVAIGYSSGWTDKAVAERRWLRLSRCNVRRGCHRSLRRCSTAWQRTAA